MTKGGHLLTRIRAPSSGKLGLLRDTLSTVRSCFFLSALVLGVFPACTSSPPRQDVHIAAPVKPIVSTTAPPEVSTPPNPPPSLEASAAAPPPAPPEPPNPDTTLALGDGTYFVVELQENGPLEAPALALELQRDNKVVLSRLGFDAITHFDLKKFHPCETWLTRVIHEDLGTSKAVRVSLICRTGEDYSTSSEIAVLVKPDDLKTIWAGLADTYNNSMDSCIEARRVTFRIVPPRTLEKSILAETTWVEQVIDGDVKTRLKRECKLGKQRRVEKIVLP